MTMNSSTPASPEHSATVDKTITKVYDKKSRCEKVVSASGYVGSALSGLGYYMADQGLVRAYPKYGAIGVPGRIGIASSIMFGMYYLSTNAAFYFCPYRADFPPSMPSTREAHARDNPLNQVKGQHM
jgi:hypothetical protein